MEIFDIRNLSFSYPLSLRKAIDNISFTVKKGEFLCICGATGSGKSTLLRLLKPELVTKGERFGEILYNGRDLRSSDAKETALSIGYVAQNPDMQIVTDKVWHELAFALENAGMSQGETARRISESASFFSLDHIFDEKISALSGGERQLLTLASVSAAEPDVLLLDEPTSSLDPISAKNFLYQLKRLNTELGISVIIAEHRLEEVIELCDRLMVMDKGKIHLLSSPREALSAIDKDSVYFSYLPAPARLWHKAGKDGTLPLSVREGRNYLSERFSAETLKEAPVKKNDNKAALAVEMKDVFFRYERSSPDILKGLSLSVYENEIFSVFGPNASGKTTALSLLCGIKKPYMGKIRIFGKPIRDYKDNSLYRECIGYLPQDVTALFLKDSVREELKDCDTAALRSLIDLEAMGDIHPYDLSGGEQQLLALCKVLAGHPRLLILDEPTKGIDPNSKENLKAVLRQLKEQGMTVIMVTHDVEFASEVSDRCALFFKGECVSSGSVKEMLSKGQFYTTAISRMTRGIIEGAVTVEDAVKAFEKAERAKL